GGDLMAFAVTGSTIGVDQDGIAAHFAFINSGADVRTVDVVDFDLDRIAAWHIDPDRRPEGRRTVSLEFCRPDLTTIERLLNRVPHSGVKLAPATPVPAEWAAKCELEWISRD